MRTASKTGGVLQAEGDWERGPPAADGNQRVVALYLIDTCPSPPGASFISNAREGRGAGLLLPLPAGRPSPSGSPRSRFMGPYDGSLCHFTFTAGIARGRGS